MLMQAVNTYLAIRRAADFKLDAVERYLRDFAQFATARGDTHVVTPTAIAWAAQATSEPQRHNRLNVVVRFARFSHAEDPRHDIPPPRVFCGQRYRPTPYLFREQDIQALVTQATRLGPPGSLRPHTYSTLLALLAVTGLRISEALALRFQDVTPDGLVIRATKFRKSRLVPLHETTTAALKGYLGKRCALALDDTHLFVSGQYRPLRSHTVREIFHQLVAAAGIPVAPGRRRPRLMDLRHTFASRALATCPDGRDHIGRHMLALTTYMGHARVKSTYWYLEQSPDLMSDIAQTCEAFFAKETS
ncbi:MAG TPA: tyrosine-type recombinase/integrase [Candidatus Saccharimonadia bacterium]|nr:tyrosine-type recombinase/integrase [Candidatus Saccharimonadia bacterium]